MQRIVSLFLALAASSTAWANYDFHTADELFLARGEGPAKIKEAVAAYQEALIDPTLTNDEKVYAVEQIGALQIYYGYIVNQDDTAARKRIATLCIQTVDKIAPTASQPKTPQYYFWKAICTMAYANADGISESLSQAKPVLKLIADGRALSASYEGGGFDRLFGVMYTKLPEFYPFGPTRDLAKAKAHFQSALDSGAYVHALNPSWRNTDYETGGYFYATHLYYAEALLAKGERAAAKKLVEDAIEAIDAGEIAPGREPETRVAEAQMRQILKRLSSKALLDRDPVRVIQNILSRNLSYL